MEYDATLLSSVDALDVGCKLARSFLDAFDVATHGAVALERINLGRWHDPRDFEECEI
jgi:hypothetical protein